MPSNEEYEEAQVDPNTIPESEQAEYEEAQIDPNAIQEEEQPVPQHKKPVKFTNVQQQPQEQSPDRMERAKARWNSVAGALKRMDSKPPYSDNQLHATRSQPPQLQSGIDWKQNLMGSGPRADWFGSGGSGISLGAAHTRNKQHVPFLLSGGFNAKPRRSPHGKARTRTPTASTNPLARALMAGTSRPTGRFRLGGTRKKAKGFSLFGSSGTMPGWMRAKGRKGTRAKWMTRL